MKIPFVFSKMLCCLLLALLLPAQALAESDKENWPIHLRFLSGPNGGQWFFMGEPLAEVLSDKVLPTTSRIGGGTANITNVHQKMGDLAFTLTGLVGAASSGEAEYQNIEAENTAMLATVYPQVFYFLVRKDVADRYGITSAEDMLRLQEPIRFASLRPGTASEFILNLILKYGYDSSFAKLKEQGWSVYFNNYAETADNFVKGELDCFAYTAGTDVPLIHTIEEYTEVLILPLSQDVLDSLQDKFGTRTYTIEAGDYKCAKAPIQTFGDYTCIIVRRDFPDDLVYEITKAIWEAKDSVAAVISDFGALSPDVAISFSDRTHPGALRFWKELIQNR